MTSGRSPALARRIHARAASGAAVVGSFALHRLRTSHRVAKARRQVGRAPKSDNGERATVANLDRVDATEVVDLAATGTRRLKLRMPILLIGALTAVTDRVLPIFPVSHDQISSLQRPNFTDLDAFERTFGVKPRHLDLSYLR